MAGAALPGLDHTAKVRYRVLPGQAEPLWGPHVQRMENAEEIGDIGEAGTLDLKKRYLPYMLRFRNA